jgi:hypothetical protein
VSPPVCQSLTGGLTPRRSPLDYFPRSQTLFGNA